MFRKWITISAMILMSTSSCLFSQDSYISLSLGGTFPKGSFAESNLLGTDGYAGSSFTMSFDGNYFMGKLGIAGMLNFGMSYLDGTSIQAARIDYLNEIFPNNVIPPDASTEFISTQWNYVNLMTGPVFALPLSFISFEIKAMGGASVVIPPQENLSVTAGTDHWSCSSSGQSLHLGYLAGGALLFHPNPGYGIRLGVDYISTSATYEMYYNLDLGGVTQNEIVSKEKVPVRLVHLTVGIFYNY
jgi:hypothetical protein